MSMGLIFKQDININDNYDKLYSMKEKTRERFLY